MWTTKAAVSRTFIRRVHKEAEAVAIIRALGGGQSDSTCDLSENFAMVSYRNVAPAKAEVQETPEKNWVPAFAGTTGNQLSVASMSPASAQRPVGSAPNCGWDLLTNQYTKNFGGRVRETTFY